MDITLGCDHGGLELKQAISSMLADLGHSINDVGCYTSDSVDYPDFAGKVCQTIIDGRAARGILVCGTGIGMSIAANRYHQIRAALCHDAFTARMSREHNDANVLCLGERVIGQSVALDLTKIWLDTEFAGGRHLRRITLMG